MRVYPNNFPEPFDPIANAVVNERIEVGFISNDVYLDPSRVTGLEDFPVDFHVEPEDLIGMEEDDIIFLHRIDYDEFSDMVHGVYWDFASLGYNFKYTCMSGSYHNERTIFFYSEAFILLAFKFDSRADAMLAKLSLLEPRIITNEIYRRLLGKTGQPAVDLPI